MTKPVQKKNSLRMWIVYVSLAVVGIAVVVAVGYTSRTPPIAFPLQAHLTVGQKAPEFTAATTQGPFDLAQNAGKPVLLEIFATWCPHCQRETVILNKIYDTYKGKVAFVSVSGNSMGMDGVTPASQADTIRFVDRFHVRYPVAYDPDLSVANKYMQSGYPTIIVIGKNGTIAVVTSGETLEPELRKSLDTALKAPF